MILTPIAQYLKLLREKKGITQEELASYIGIERQSYSHYETSRNIPPTEALLKIAQYYNISLDKLIRLTSISTKGVEADLDSREVLNEKPDLQTGLDNLYVDFLNKCSGMTTKEIYNWLKVEDMELIHYYHQLSKRNRRIISYLIRLMNIKEI